MPREFKTALEVVEAALADGAERRSKPYDGIVGALPEWVPLPVVIDFEFIQVKLLSELKHSEDEIRRYMEVYEQDISLQSMISSIPVRILDYIGQLCKVKGAVEAGPEEGLRILLGETTSEKIAFAKRTAEGQRTRAQKKRGRLDDSDETLNEVIEKLEKRYPDLLAKQIWDHFRSELESLGLDPKEEVNPSDSNLIALQYYFRGRSKQITFGRFAVVISGFRSKKKYC